MGAPDTVEESLSVALNGLVPVAVVQELERWVERQVAGVVRPLRSALVSLSSDVPAIQKPSDAQSPLPIGPIFAACHPSRFRTTMEDALAPESLWQDYQSTLDLIVQFTPEGRLFDRYRLPQPVFMDAMNQGVKTLENMQTALVQYAVELNGLAEKLRVLRGGRGVKTGLKVGASLLGGMLLGPIGARAASFITGEMTSKHEEVYEVLVGVKERFAELMKVVLPICDDVETDLTRVLLDVYGGLLVRVGEDLREAGRGIVQVSFAHGLVLVHLADDELRQLRDGVERVRTEIEASIAEENWSDVAERSHAMLEWLLALPGRSWVGPETHSGESVGVGVESYTVLFARWRALALRKLGDAAWDSGDLARAGSLYRFLLEASPVAFGVEGAKGVGPSELAVAGWRLALMSTGRS